MTVSSSGPDPRVASKGCPGPVDFMILGAQRAGTTTLFDILKESPGFAACHYKEPHFFSLSEDWRAEAPAYHSLFEWTAGALHFEASTSYAFSPQSRLCIWRDLYEYNSRLKFIYIVRDPIERIISSYMLYYEKGHTDDGLAEAIVADGRYIDATRYYSQLLPYIDTFGRDRLLLLDFDDLTADLDGVMRSVSDFLGVPIVGPFDMHSNRSIGGQRMHHRFNRPTRPQRIVRRLLPPVWKRLTDNSARGFAQKPQMPPRLREAVLLLLTADVRALEPLLGKNLDHWLRVERPLDDGESG